MIDIDENVSNEEMKEHDPHHPRRNDLSFFNLIDSWELVLVIVLSRVMFKTAIP